ncbi:hypothetical protein niasHT_001794 [Heterodera trifolii]|uniref:Uncharacterized protein n=1 Tax=Heterodera trifolii TaxID=157864 RepID=A0ABD2MBP2_9BILA
MIPFLGGQDVFAWPFSRGWGTFSRGRFRVGFKKLNGEMHSKDITEKGGQQIGGQGEVGEGGTAENGQQRQNRGQSGDAGALPQRTMGALYEMTPELENNQDEIRKLDSQLDHLNDYMDRVEERLKTHNDKLMETLRQQREDREKRRRSFHERLEQSRQEDDDFQQQLSSVLSRVDSVRSKKTEPKVKLEGD